MKKQRLLDPIEIKHAVKSGQISFIMIGDNLYCQEVQTKEVVMIQTINQTGGNQK